MSDLISPSSRRDSSVCAVHRRGTVLLRGLHRRAEFEMATAALTAEVQMLSLTSHCYPTFRNLCSERKLSGGGLSLKVCGQLVHDTTWPEAQGDQDKALYDHGSPQLRLQMEPPRSEY